MDLKQSKRRDDRVLAEKWNYKDDSLLTDLMLLYLDRCKFVN